MIRMHTGVSERSVSQRLMGMSWKVHVAWSYSRTGTSSPGLALQGFGRQILNLVGRGRGKRREVVWAGMSPGQFVCSVVTPQLRRQPALLWSLGGFYFLDNCPIQGTCRSPVLTFFQSWLEACLPQACPQLHPHCPNPEQLVSRYLMTLWQDSAVLTLWGQGL